MLLFQRINDVIVSKTQWCYHIPQVPTFWLQTFLSATCTCVDLIQFKFGHSCNLWIHQLIIVDMCPVTYNVSCLIISRQAKAELIHCDTHLEAVVLLKVVLRGRAGTSWDITSFSSQRNNLLSCSSRWLLWISINSGLNFSMLKIPCQLRGYNFAAISDLLWLVSGFVYSLLKDGGWMRNLVLDVFCSEEVDCIATQDHQQAV